MTKNSLSLYIHWPFCLSKCPYCDFNSHVSSDFKESSWQKSIIHELRRMAEETNPRTLETIFFGGGTPSLMDPETVGIIIKEASQLWSPSPHLEITLEANPNSAEVERFKRLRDEGVNRLSIGIQALTDIDLKKLGRTHTAQEGIQAIRAACQTFDRVSFDLIYARPHQTLDEWKKELSLAFDFGTTHLSLYQLTIEPGTVFSTLHRRGDLVLPSANLSADFFEYTQEQTGLFGLNAYEISNYAHPGFECQHNLAYWRYKDYIGVGPGAHSRITKKGKKYAIHQKKTPHSWVSSIENDGSGNQEKVPLSPWEQFQERLMMGLRLNEEIELGEGMKFLDSSRVDSLVTEEYLVKKGKTIQSTDAGRQRLNAVLDYLLQGVKRQYRYEKNAYSSF